MDGLIETIEAAPRLTRFGRVARLEGLLVEVTGAQGPTGLGGRVHSVGAGGETPCAELGAGYADLERTIEAASGKGEPK